MTITTGQTIPSCELQIMTDKGPETLDSLSLFSDKKVLLFAVPGAFTPGCSKTHLPGYVALAEKIKTKGVDTIICMAVNDAFVMDAWGKAHNADQIQMVADGNAAFASALGLEKDASAYGMGLRCSRFAMIVENSVVSELVIEPPGGIVETTAEAFLAKL